MSDNTRDKVMALHAEGKTYGQIAVRLGLSRGTVGGHINREMERRTREGMDIQNDRIRLRHSEGWTCERIAAEVGLEKDNVRLRARRMGLDFMHHAPSALCRENNPVNGADTARLSQIEDDARFQSLLMDAWRRGEFPGQSFKLVAE